MSGKKGEHEPEKEGVLATIWDYAKTFLAAGEATGVAAFPYESIYTNKKREIGGRTEQETLALYALHGWEPSKDMFRTMNDHIGLELEFMAVLCEEELLSCQTDNADRVPMPRLSARRSPLPVSTRPSTCPPLPVRSRWTRSTPSSPTAMPLSLL